MGRRSCHQCTFLVANWFKFQIDSERQLTTTRFLTHANVCLICTGVLSDSYLHAFFFLVHLSEYIGRISEDLPACLGCSIQALPSLCLLSDLTNVNMETNISNMLLVALSIAQENCPHVLEIQKELASWFLLELSMSLSLEHVCQGLSCSRRLLGALEA